MAVMTSFQAEKCCHLVSKHEACAWRLCSSVREFLVYKYIRSCWARTWYRTTCYLVLA